MRGAVRAVLAFVAVAALAAFLASRGCEEAEESPGRTEDVGPATDRVEQSPSAPAAAPGRARGAATGDAAAEAGLAKGDDATPPGHVSGWVTAGAAIEGASVRLYRTERWGEVDASYRPHLTALAPVEDEVRTDADGHFRIAAPPNSHWTVVIDTEGRAFSLLSGSGPSHGTCLSMSVRAPISICVEDEEGRPLRDAEALVFNYGPRPVFRVGADANGTIRLVRDLPILVGAPGSAWESVREPRDGQRVRLVPAGPVAGRVEDDAGTPIAGASVMLTDRANLLDFTDAEGAFRFDRVALRCGAWGNGLVAWIATDRVETMRVVTGDEDVRIVFRRGHPVAGVVEFPDGRPAAGARVGTATTDVDGRFQVECIPYDAGRCVVSAILTSPVPGFAEPLVTHTGREVVSAHSSGRTDGVRIALREEPRSFVRLDVRGEDECEIRPHVSIVAPWVVNGAGDGCVLRAVGVPPGTTLRIDVECRDRSHARALVDVVTSPDPSAEPVVVRLTARRSYGLRVVDSRGAVVPAGEVAIPRSETGEHVNGYVVLAPDGRILGFEGGRLNLEILVRGVRYERVVIFPSRPLDVVEFVLPATGTLRGRFVGSDGRPAVGVRATARPSAADVASVSASPTGTDGLFVLPSVPAGDCTLFAARTVVGPVAFDRPVAVPVGGDLDVGDIVVWDQVRLEGRVIDARGIGVGGAWVEASWNAGRASRSIATDPGGDFSLDVAGAPDAVVTATRERVGACVEAIDFAPGRATTLRLQPAGTIEVRSPLAVPNSSLRVRVEFPSRSCSWRPDVDIDGLATIAKGIPAGRWVVVVLDQGVASRREVVVPAGGNVVVEFGP